MMLVGSLSGYGGCLASNGVHRPEGLMTTTASPCLGLSHRTRRHQAWERPSLCRMSSLHLSRVSSLNKKMKAERGQAASRLKKSKWFATEISMFEHTELPSLACVLFTSTFHFHGFHPERVPDILIYQCLGVSIALKIRHPPYNQCENLEDRAPPQER